jgi:hypothetical protein
MSKMDRHWKDDEVAYCLGLVHNHGDDKVGHDPKSIATYLRLQASAAFSAQQFEISARLGTAATAINEDARNNHTPNWDRAFGLLMHICATLNA